MVQDDALKRGCSGFGAGRVSASWLLRLFLAEQLAVRGELLSERQRHAALLPGGVGLPYMREEQGPYEANSVSEYLGCRRAGADILESAMVTAARLVTTKNAGDS